jgi:GDP-4-dehydro-6-deoxy-D-mannose reductase
MNSIALVTGATGALGRAVVARLHATGTHRVVAASRRPDATDAVRLDVCDTDSIAAVMREVQPSLVLHLAASFSDDLDEARAINVDAARHLLDSAMKGAQPCRVLLVGSAAEYGAVDPRENPVREDHRLAPVSTYGLTKAWQSLLAGAYAARGADVVVARIFNLDGPGMSERLFIGRIERQIRELRAGGRTAIEVGALTAVRDYVAIEAAARQVLAIASDGARGEVYHVASGAPVTMQDLLARHLAQHGVPTSAVRSSPQLSNHRGYDAPAIWADVTRTLQLPSMRGSGG